MISINELQKYIVKVISYKIYKSYSKPGNIKTTASTSGSGFFYEGWGIVTNAHCVDNATRIVVQKYGDATPHPATVVAISYECDLALLSLGGKNKFEGGGLKPSQKFSKLDSVFVLGYPLGGLNISVTKGVINRVQMIEYFHVSNGIVIQIDAAINNGNSGGPAVNEFGELVGIAFAGESDAQTQNMGYIIPTRLLEYFLQRTKAKGEYKYNTGLGIETQSMINKGMQRHYSYAGHGIAVSKIYPFSSGGKSLKIGDIITNIDGIPIESNGTIKLSNVISDAPDEMIPFQFAASLKQPGEKIMLGIFRKAKHIELELTVRPYIPNIPLLDYMQPPKFLILGGLVIAPLTMMILQEKRKAGEYYQNLVEFENTFVKQHPDDEILFITNILQTEETQGYDHHNQIIKTINDTIPHNLEHLYKLTQQTTTKLFQITFHDYPHEMIIETTPKRNKQIAKDQLDLPDYYFVDHGGNPPLTPFGLKK